jgi:tetratricopeptide (TPR) repeat protein
MIRVAMPVAICVAFVFAAAAQGQKMLHGVTVPRQGHADKEIADRNYEAAIRILSKWLDENPTDIEARDDRAFAFRAAGKYREAAADYESLLKSKTPEIAWQSYAKLLSTCPDEKIRDGARAEKFATKILEFTQARFSQSQAVPECMDTLAAAFAAEGKFDDAIQWQKKAIELSHPSRHKDMTSRLKLYEAGKPYILQPVVAKAKE